MAQSLSFFGLRRGSTKSHTYQVYRGKQITKDRVVSVSNPQTIQQMQQRIKLAMLSCTTSVLKGLIDHSFEGVSYGRDSISKFKEINLSKDGMTDIVSWIPKGMSDTGNANYQISKGSLDQLEIDLDTSADSAAETYVAAVNEMGGPETDTYDLPAVKAGDEVTGNWAKLINKLLGLDDDSQITVLVNYLGTSYTFDVDKETKGTTKYHKWVISRWIANQDKQKGVWTFVNPLEATTADKTDNIVIQITDGYLEFQIFGSSYNLRAYSAKGNRIVGGTVILSQYVDGTWKRSTQYMECGTPPASEKLDDSYEDVVYSYLKTQSTSEKYLNTGIEGVGIEGSNKTTKTE